MATKRFKCVVLLGLCLIIYIFLYENKDSHTQASQIVNNKRFVAITFDDGPNYSTTMKLLEGLRERNVKATFFIVGERVEYSREVVLQMSKDGHLIGNHTYTHAQLTEIPIDKAIEEINKTNDMISKVTGKEVTFIRPPCGSWNSELTSKIDMIPVFWDVDPKDWCRIDISDVVDSVVNTVDDGDIILFHDIYDTSVVAALEVIDRLKDMGYEFVTVDRIMLE